MQTEKVLSSLEDEIDDIYDNDYDYNDDETELYDFSK